METLTNAADQKNQSKEGKEQDAEWEGPIWSPTLQT